MKESNRVENLLRETKKRSFHSGTHGIVRKAFANVCALIKYCVRKIFQRFTVRLVCGNGTTPAASLTIPIGIGVAHPGMISVVSLGRNDISDDLFL